MLNDLDLQDVASFHNNAIDHFGGHTFGCHENYLVQIEDRFFTDALSYLLPFLDGTRTADDLVELVLANPTLSVEKEGEELSDPEVKRPLLRAQVTSSLEGLAHAAVIEA